GSERGAKRRARIVAAARGESDAAGRAKRARRIRASAKIVCSETGRIGRASARGRRTRGGKIRGEAGRTNDTTKRAANRGTSCKAIGAARSRKSHSQFADCRRFRNGRRPPRRGPSTVG